MMPWAGRYGACAVVGIPTPRGKAVMALGGALSTFSVAAIATALLLMRRWGRYGRPLLITLSFWWFDLLTYTLPSWGLPHSIVWGQNWYSEPYEAALALGIPGTTMRILTIASCAGLLAIVCIRIYSEMKHPITNRRNSELETCVQSVGLRERE